MKYRTSTWVVYNQSLGRNGKAETLPRALYAAGVEKDHFVHIMAVATNQDEEDIEMIANLPILSEDSVVIHADSHSAFTLNELL